MTTEQLLDKAFEPMIKFLKNYGDKPMTIKQHPYYHSEEEVPFGTRLRLDWEIVDTEEDLEVADTFHLFAKSDLLELIENGDVQNSGDWLLSAMDGSKKRGKEPSRIVIREAQVIAEPNSRKETIEYTMFLNLYVDWE